MITARACVVSACLCAGLAFGQAAPAADQPIVITIEGDNYVIYRGNTFDLTKIAKDPKPAVSAQTAFLTFVNVGDIRSVNGKPAKGLYSSQGPAAMPYRANPQPGQPISDMDSGGMMQCVWQILSTDGKLIGTIIDSGMVNSEHAVVGGVGAFLGMTGMHQVTQSVVPQRQASSSEDPANRRIHGGGTFRDVFYLYPKSRPAVITTAGVPAIIHQDGRVVSSANPAQAGEILTLYASGLGPTTPAVAIGKPFPSPGEARVNAPVEITVNGNTADVLYAGGAPGAVDGYQVNFQMPASLTAGTATLQLTSAWIPGTPVPLAVK